MASKLFTTENKTKILNIFYNVGAVLIMNSVLQFVLYPYFRRLLGSESYGVALTLMSVISITAGSVGTAANYSRLVSQKILRPSNGDYFVLILLAGVVSALIGAIFLWKFDLLSPVSVILLSLVIIFTAYRYYGDVEYKLNTAFLKYFLFYLAISIGYGVGALAFKITRDWMIAILLGEVFGVAFSAFFSRTFRKPFEISSNFKLVAKSFSLLLMSYLLENLTLNADRILLAVMEGGEAVTIYYNASLFGKVIALMTVPINSLIISYLVRFEGGLTKKLWFLFVGGVVALGVFGFIGCFVGSVIILPVLYPEDYAAVKLILTPAIISQIFYFTSSILLVVLLKFFGEKKQFLFNFIYGVGFFALTFIGTKFLGLNGFVWFSFGVNALRLLLVAIVGFFGKSNSSAAKNQVRQ
ncbi:MAG: lipopolysaccharide biosynthesis protein [Christensenellaceae bacterium]